MKLTGAQALVNVLTAEQVRFAFGIVGGKLAPLLHAIAREPDIRYVGVRHESAGPMMAAAAYAGSGRMAVALGEMGPGGLNLAAGAGVACNNNLAVLLITSNQHRAAGYPHGGMFMDLDTLAVFKPVTKWNAVVHDPRRMPELARRAFREALGGRPGPVHLDIPQDVLAAECEFADDEFDLSPRRYRAVEGPRASAQGIAAAAELLQQARRPLIVAGGGVVASGAEQRVRELAQLLGAPVVPSQMALGVVATDGPHFIGHGGLIAGDAVHEAFAQADVILAAGCRFSSWMWDERGPLARRHHRLINVNIDPTALGAPTLHEVALHADADLALADLQAALGNAGDLAVDADWLPRLRKLRAQYEHKLGEMALAPAPAMHPAALARAIAAALPRDALVVYDGGHTTFWSNDLTPAYDVRTRFHDPGMSQLGFGLPYALALQLIHPGRPVVNITGDGAFGFTLQELDTARRHGLPAVTIIHNNAAWGIIRAGQRAQLDFELGTSLADTDYAAIARGFGCLGETVTEPDALRPALRRALSSSLPSVIDCRTCFVPHPCLPAFGRMNQYGFDALTRPVNSAMR
jgi:thiamine pyrophosphate-dependent acetolactate synthase large subunit-like protein